MCEIILRAVHSFVSTFSVELFISKFFLLGQSFAWTMPTRTLLTFISVVLSACCFLVVITSDLLSSHRIKDLFPVCQWSVSVCSLKVTAFYAMPCKNHIATIQASFSLAYAFWNGNRNWNHTGIFCQLPGRQDSK